MTEQANHQVNALACKKALQALQQKLFIAGHEYEEDASNQDETRAFLKTPIGRFSVLTMSGDGNNLVTIEIAYTPLKATGFFNQFLSTYFILDPYGTDTNKDKVDTALQELLDEIHEHIKTAADMVQ